MTINTVSLVKAFNAVKNHPATTPAAFASVITAGLYLAQAVGAPIPTLALTFGPLFGYVIYKLSPPKAQAVEDQIVKSAESLTDNATAEIISAVQNTQVDPTFPGNDGKKSTSIGPANGNYNKG